MQQVEAPAPKPLLASEVLADELAPLEPARLSSRVWLLGVALSLTLLGVALREGVGVPAARIEGSTISFSAAGAVAAVALLPFPYALRAGVSLLLGAVLMTMGLRGSGPLAGLTVDGGELRALAQLTVLSTLPAALLLRARYIKYRPPRWILGAAWFASVPLLLLQVGLAADVTAPLMARALAGANIGVVVCALFGFMPDSSTGGSTIWAALVLAAPPAAVALRQLTPLAAADTGLSTYPATAVGMLCAAILACLGLYQLLAAALGPRARAELSTRRGPEGS